MAATISSGYGKAIVPNGLPLRKKIRLHSDLMRDAPIGTISFLFTDIVGSTRLWEKHPNHMGAALARHDTILRGASEAHGGYVFKTVGDAFCVAFQTPRDAILAAIEAQHALDTEEWNEIAVLKVRMGIHTGAAEFRGGDYFGGTLNRASRIESAAHGGQILLSQITCELLQDEGLQITFKSLGEHRLRNLDRPEHLFQAMADGLGADFPPPKSMEVLPNNLPVQTTSFIGREREMEEVHRLLEKGRLVTLTGTGGTGKTRLSLEVGARLINEFHDGVWQVELAPISDPERVAELVGNVLGMREEPGKPLRTSLLNFLKPKSLLIILDNCEHLIAPVSSLISEWLRSCPHVKVLATSRHSLGVAGETTFSVPPLGILDTRLYELSGADMAERLSQFDAVKLFIERATAVRADFTVTNTNAPALAEICSRLDGIPLAIELAAARVRVLTVEQIAARLGDRFQLLRNANRSALPHQQTLQALIDWSHDLLSDEERIVFRRLGAFIGGRTLEALESVCSGDGVEEYEVLDLLQQLVDKSLVTVEKDANGDFRYTLIESVWQYSREKLDASGEADAVHNRHLNYFLKLAEEAMPHLEGPDQKNWLDRCQREFFNFRTAVQWAIQSKQPEPAMRIVHALHRNIEIRGNLGATQEIGDQLLALPDDDIPPKLKAQFRTALGRLAWAADQYEEAGRYHREAKALYDSIGDEEGSALSDILLAFLDRGNGELDTAEERFKRGQEIGHRLKIPFIKAAGITGLGSVALDRGEVDKARQLKEESLEIYEQLGDHWIIGLILWGITQVSIAQKDYKRAESALEQWGSITRMLGNRWILSYILDSHAALAIATNQPEQAARFFGASEVLCEQLGGQYSPSEQSQHDVLLKELKGMLATDEYEASWEAGRVTPPWEVIEQAKT